MVESDINDFLRSNSNKIEMSNNRLTKSEVSEGSTFISNLPAVKSPWKIGRVKSVLIDEIKAETVFKRKMSISVVGEVTSMITDKCDNLNTQLVDRTEDFDKK